MGLIIRPTGCFNPGGASNPQYSYDGVLSTALTLLSPNAYPECSVGGDTANEGTIKWGTIPPGIVSAVIYARFSKPAGTDDLVDLAVGKLVSGVWTHIAYLVAPTIGAVAEADYFQVILASDVGGNFLWLNDLRVRLGGNVDKGADGITSSLFDVWLDVVVNVNGDVAADLPAITSSMDVGGQVDADLPSITSDIGATFVPIPLPSASLTVTIPANKIANDITDYRLRVNLSPNTGVTDEDTTDIAKALANVGAEYLYAYNSSEVSLKIDAAYFNTTTGYGEIFILVPLVSSTVDTVIEIVADDSNSINSLVTTTYSTGNITDQVWAYYTSAYTFSPDQDEFDSTGSILIHNRASTLNPVLNGHDGNTFIDDKVGPYVKISQNTNFIDGVNQPGSTDWEFSIVFSVPADDLYRCLFKSTTNLSAYVEVMLSSSTGLYTVITRLIGDSGVKTISNLDLDADANGWVELTFRHTSSPSRYMYYWHPFQITPFDSGFGFGNTSSAQDVPGDSFLSRELKVASIRYKYDCSHQDDKRLPTGLGFLDRLITAELAHPGNSVDTILPAITGEMFSGFWKPNQYIKLFYDSSWNAASGSITYATFKIVLSNLCGRNDVNLKHIFEELGNDPSGIRINKTNVPDDTATELYAEVVSWDDVNEFAVLYFNHGSSSFDPTVDNTFYLHYDNNKVNDEGKIRLPGESNGAFSFKDKLTYPDATTKVITERNFRIVIPKDVVRRSLSWHKLAASFKRANDSDAFKLVTISLGVRDTGASNPWETIDDPVLIDSSLGLSSFIDYTVPVADVDTPADVDLVLCFHYEILNAGDDTYVYEPRTDGIVSYDDGGNLTDTSAQKTPSGTFTSSTDIVFFTGLVFPDLIKDEVWYRYVSAYFFNFVPATGTNYLRCQVSGHIATLYNGASSMAQGDYLGVGPYWRFNGVDQYVANLYADEYDPRDYQMSMSIKDHSAAKDWNPIICFSPDYVPNYHYYSAIIFSMSNHPSLSGDLAAQPGRYESSVPFDGSTMVDLHAWGAYSFFYDYDGGDQYNFVEHATYHTQSKVLVYFDTLSELMRDAIPATPVYADLDISFIGIDDDALQMVLRSDSEEDTFWDYEPSLNHCSMDVDLPTVTCLMEAYAGDVAFEANVPMIVCIMGSGASLIKPLPTITGVFRLGPALESILPAITFFGLVGHNTSDFESTVPAVTCEIQARFTKNDLEMELPGIISDCHAGASFIVDLPSIFASDWVGYNGNIASLSADLPILLMTSYNGSWLHGAFPGIRCEIAARTDIFAHLKTDLPKLLFLGESKSDIIATLDSRLPRLVVAMRGRIMVTGWIDSDLPQIYGDLEGTSGAVGSLEARLANIRCLMLGVLSRTDANLIVDLPAIVSEIKVQVECEGEILRFIKGVVR